MYTECCNAVCERGRALKCKAWHVHSKHTIIVINFLSSAQTNNSSHLSLDSTPIYYRSQRNKACCISHHHLHSLAVHDSNPLMWHVQCDSQSQCFEEPFMYINFICNYWSFPCWREIKGNGVLSMCKLAHWSTELQIIFSELTLRKIKCFINNTDNQLRVQCAFQTYFLSLFYLLQVSARLHAHCI